MRQQIAMLRHSKVIPILVLFTFVFQLITEEMQAWTPDAPDDYKYFIMPYVEQCNPLEYPKRVEYVADPNGVPTYGHNTQPTRDPLKWWTNCISYKLTDSPKFIPIIFNVSIIPLAYLLAVTLTKDRLVGLIAVSALILNPIFTRFEGSGTYDSVWSFFLLLSALFVLRIKDRVALSVPVFFVSLAAKAMGILYIPSLLYMLHKSDRTKKAKWITVFGLIGGLAGLGMLVHPTFLLGANIAFHPENIELAISQNIKMLWEILPVLIVMVGINRLLSPKVKVQGKSIAGIWMLNALLITPLIYLFSNQLAFVYRFTPFVVFMSIYIGIVIIEAGNRITERQLAKIKTH